MNSYDLEQAQGHFAARLAFTTGVHELDAVAKQHRDDVVIVDVRMPSDYAKGHVPGAVNLPRGKWQNPKGPRADATHYVYCYDQTCHLAAEAALALTRQGFRAVEVEGGWDRWQAKGLPSETATRVA